MTTTLLGLTADQWTVLATASNVVLPLALAIFALLQWKAIDRQADLQEAAETARELEANAEVDRQTDLAYRIIWAEWFRIRAVAVRWRDRGLLAEAASGTLRPDDLLPRDWGLLTEQLGRLGREPAHIGSVGLTLAYDAAHEAGLVAESFRVIRSSPGYKAIGAIAAVQTEHSPVTDGILRSADAALALADNAAAALEEALNLAPNADKLRAFAIPENPVSGVGQWLKSMAQKRTNDGPPQRDNH